MTKTKITTLKFFSILFIFQSVLLAQQINISRVEMMPNFPTPYEMRDWKQVTIGYDSFVFDFNLSGQYLPLIWQDANGVNYPNHDRFGLHTVVGTPYLGSAEAINVLPAVIGASLVGIDKSSQNGKNWVLMCEEYFNRRPEENIYLNHPVASSGDDWWYETMPNVFFYQLYDLYPHTGDFDYQFISVANQWLNAVYEMGGGTTPWSIPYMNYRAWDFSSMTPNSNGVPEPEAAGVIAWILYNAYCVTGIEEYRIGAELAIEFLDDWSSNPSYEIQLPYGVYIAARMNAELGTTYDIDKMINWCFDFGSLRSWGITVGNWGGYDCSGLVGEIIPNSEYAFIMNGFEHAGALVPMICYDDQYARAIGKWILNLANASRLFYPNYLDSFHQDGSYNWAVQYDSNSVIAHEAMRSSYLNIEPYATGDAITGGWGATTLTLYSSSHVGIFGGIIDTTNIEYILQLDVLKTDYFGDNAYQTYLYYNPYQTAQNVEIDVGAGIYDLYDMVSNSFLASNVTGLDSFSISADAAAVVVLAPAGGTITYDLNKTLINGVIVDYNSGQLVSNYPPRIKSLSPDSQITTYGGSLAIYCTAADRDNDSLIYNWSSTGGTITGIGEIVTWMAPAIPDSFQISCMVDDGNGGIDTASTIIEVVEAINHNPIIEQLKAQPRKIDLSAYSLLTCTAIDVDGDSLQYSWFANFGSISGNGGSITWTAPNIAGNYYINCIVSDNKGGQTIDSIAIVVRDFSSHGSGNLVAYFPFNGNANDESGNNHHGIVFGASLVADRFGNTASAYYFDGINDYIRIANHDSLNFQNGITINFWMQVAQFYTREAYPISHGNWENRWKVSIGNEHLRWTVKTNNGIKDLDTETALITSQYINATVFYDGSDFEIYLNGELDSFSSWSGQILPTSIDLTIGQVLPNNSNYNFNGIIDDIRIYNYGLSVAEIEQLYQTGSSIINENHKILIPYNYVLFQNYPNPFNTQTTILYGIPDKAKVRIEIYDNLGKLVKILLNEKKNAGYHQLSFDASSLASGIYFYKIQVHKYLQVKKMILMK